MIATETRHGALIKLFKKDKELAEKLIREAGGDLAEKIKELPAAPMSQVVNWLGGTKQDKASVNNHFAHYYSQFRQLGVSKIQTDDEARQYDAIFPAKTGGCLASVRSGNNPYVMQREAIVFVALLLDTPRSKTIAAALNLSAPIKVADLFSMAEIDTTRNKAPEVVQHIPVALPPIEEVSSPIETARPTWTPPASIAFSDASILLSNETGIAAFYPADMIAELRYFDFGMNIFEAEAQGVCLAHKSFPVKHIYTDCKDLALQWKQWKRSADSITPLDKAFAIAPVIGNCAALEWIRRDKNAIADKLAELAVKQKLNGRFKVTFNEEIDLTNPLPKGANWLSIEAVEAANPISSLITRLYEEDELLSKKIVELQNKMAALTEKKEGIASEIILLTTVQTVYDKYK